MASTHERSPDHGGPEPNPLLVAVIVLCLVLLLGLSTLIPASG